MNKLTRADLVIEARWVIPVAPAGIVLEHHSVVIRNGQISQILPSDQAHKTGIDAEHTESLPNHVLIPGLVNAHTHAATSLMRGLVDDLSRENGEKAVLSAQEKLFSPRFVEDSCLLAAAEMLQGGITCANDMHLFAAASARAFSKAGMRAVVGMMILDRPSAYAADVDDYLRKGLQIRDEWKHDPLISFSLAPYAPNQLNDACLERIRTLADELDCPIHTHVHGTRVEIEESENRYGLRPLARLEKQGLLSANLNIADGVFLTEGELERLVHFGVAVIHNPTSNMKLAKGAAPVSAMLSHGLVVGLGSDDATSNNRFDIFQEMRQAALLAKLRESDASALPAHDVLHMATLGGAQAIGQSNTIGSIEPGKAADLCAVSLASLSNTPCFDPAAQLVYTAGRESVSHVWIAGQLRVRDGKLLSLSNNELICAARMWQNVTKE